MQRWQLAAVAVAVVGLIGFVFVTPTTALPVGVSPSDGLSMGHDEPGLVVYVDQEPEVGDVIVFDGNTDSDEWTRHRIVDETEDGFVTQGDANPGVDQGSMLGMDHATEDNTAGVVLFRVPLLEAGAAWSLFVVGVGAIKYRTARVG